MPSFAIKCQKVAYANGRPTYWKSACVNGVSLSRFGTTAIIPGERTLVRSQLGTAGPTFPRPARGAHMQIQYVPLPPGIRSPRATLVPGKYRAIAVIGDDEVGEPTDIVEATLPP